DGREHRRSRQAGGPMAARTILGTLGDRTRHGFSPRNRSIDDRSALPRFGTRGDRCPGPTVVLPWRRGRTAPAIGTFRSTVRHLVVGHLSTSERFGRVQTHARWSFPRTGPGKRGQTILHLPQPRLLAFPAGYAHE